MKELYEKFENFFDDFESDFKEHFKSLVKFYYKSNPHHNLELISINLYQVLIYKEKRISLETRELFYDMEKNGVMIGFVVNKTLFYLLERFIQFSSKNNSLDAEYIDSLFLKVHYFTEYIEKIANDNYKTMQFDIEEETTQSNKIVKILEMIKNKQESVDFFNLYKGVPITYKAKILDIKDEEVIFETDSIQEIAIKIDGFAYIMKDDFFDNHIRADVSSSIFYDKKVALKNFTYLLNLPKIERKSIRVHPNISVFVNMREDKEFYTKGKLFDLSVNGLCVVSEFNYGLHAGAKTEISFELKWLDIGMIEKIKTKGEIINIVEYSNSYVYSISIFPEEKVKERIAKYIKAMEEETLKNLKSLLNNYN